jgi:hypothetical protein
MAITTKSSISVNACLYVCFTHFLHEVDFPNIQYRGTEYLALSNDSRRFGRTFLRIFFGAKFSAISTAFESFGKPLKKP